MTTGLIIDSLTQSIFHCMWERSNEEEDRIKCQEIKRKLIGCLSWKCTVSCGISHIKTSDMFGIMIFF
jgi:hypothetical protein